MSTFCILTKGKYKKNYTISDFEIIKIGYSWSAFFLSFIWGFSNKLWKYSFLFTAVFLILFCANLFSLVGNFFLMICLILNNFYWGIFGNSILINNLIEKKGLKPEKLINSSNYDEANLIFISGK